MAFWSEKQRQCLDAIGVQLWEPRRLEQAEPMPAIDLGRVSPSGRNPTGSASARDVGLRCANPTYIPDEEIPAAAVPIAEVPAPAESPLDWDGLAACVAACERCPELVANRSQTVFGVGNRESDLLVIGEAPGADEDRLGEPFVGRAGKLLDAMLAAIGFDRRRNVYIANILKCRPPNNRDPLPEEAANCRGFLQRQVELAAPRVILAVGRIAAQQLLGSEQPIGRLRGQRHQLAGVPLVVTYHPAYLLRSPGEKRKAWDDLRFAHALLKEPA